MKSSFETTVRLLVSPGTFLFGDLALLKSSGHFFNPQGSDLAGGSGGGEGEFGCNFT